MNRSRNAPHDKRSWFHYFAIVATILGFIVDAIAILGILSVVQLPDLASQAKLTPLHAFGVWALAVFTYLGFVHLYWTKNMIQNQYESDFLVVSVP